MTGDAEGELGAIVEGIPFKWESGQLPRKGRCQHSSLSQYVNHCELSSRFLAIEVLRSSWRGSEGPAVPGRECEAERA